MSERLVRISRGLSKDLQGLEFGAPVAYVYDPLSYARASHEQYLTRYGTGPKEAIFLGMNPGPFGMAQTGVPFGDVPSVRDFLGIEGAVSRPPREHPKRPVLGFAHPRVEVSGTRLWGFFKETFGTPERFFERFFVVNYCPLLFLEEGGRNLTPDKLAKHERALLLERCDRALTKMVEALEPSLVIGIGAFAASSAARALGGDVRVAQVLHPSPANPRANRGWAAEVRRDLEAAGVRL
jgi:single-strand selective monofunctional uracil DNA glycosylase